MSANNSAFEEMAERLFGEFCPQKTAEAAELHEFPTALWAAIEGAGITTMLLPEEKGGVGATFEEAGAIARVAGAASAPGPLVETMIAAMALEKSGIAVPAGPLALAFIENDSDLPREAIWRPLAPLREVAWAKQAAAVVVIVKDPTATGVVLSQSAHWSMSDDKSVIGEPRSTLSAASVPLNAFAVAEPVMGTQLFAAAGLLRAGQILGALEWCLDRTVAYAQERKQFGREIGRFQVVQQQLADLAGHVAAAGAVFDVAAMNGPSDMDAIAACRSRLGDAIDTVVAISHQVHGAIGFSREYGLNFRTRRLLAWRDDFGSVPYWRRQLSGSSVGKSAWEIWPLLAAIGSRAPIGSGTSNDEIR